MFPKVKCTGYLEKSKKPKSYLKSDENGNIKRFSKYEEIEVIEVDDIVTNEIYEMKQCKHFKGVCVGTVNIATKQDVWYETDCWGSDDIFFKSQKKDFLKCGKVYYAKNRSRLVPLDYMTEEA